MQVVSPCFSTCHTFGSCGGLWKLWLTGPKLGSTEPEPTSETEPGTSVLQQRFQNTPGAKALGLGVDHADAGGTHL